MSKNNNKYSKPIDKYEEDLEAFLNKGVYLPTENQEESLLELQEAAKNYLKSNKSKSITLRVGGEDLIKMKVKAQKRGLPYQRVINMLISGYANNKIKLSI